MVRRRRLRSARLQHALCGGAPAEPRALHPPVEAPVARQRELLLGEPRAAA